MTTEWSERIEQALREFIVGLKKERVRYCIVGALALGAWGQPRATQDLDVLMVLEGKKRDHLLQALQNRGFSLDTEWAEHNPMIRDKHVRLLWSGIPVDLMSTRDDHDKNVLVRRRRVPLGPVPLWVAGPEDLILQKLKAGRPRDLEDSLSVIVRQGKRLNMKYLNRWARSLGVHEELTYLMKHS